MKIFKAKMIFTIFINMLFFGNSSAIMPNLKLPFDAGESWQVTRGYENPDCLTNPLIKCTSHTNWGLWADDRYAIDMTEGGCGSWNKPALAIADGSVIQIHSDNAKPYGRYVIIDHSDNYRSRYAHLNSIGVTLNQKVSQGQEIGKVGNSGTGVVGTACPNHPGTHLHLALYHNGVAVKPEPMSGYTDFTEGKTYISNNYTSSISTSTTALLKAGALVGILNIRRPAPMSGSFRWLIRIKTELSILECLALYSAKELPPIVLQD